jgi:RHS repeat-associated protein
LDTLGRAVAVQNCKDGPTAPPFPASTPTCTGTDTTGTATTVLRTSTSSGSTPNARTVTAFDENLVSRTSYFDGLGRLVQVTENGSEITRYAYDALDNLTGVTQPGGQSRSFGYDSLSRLLTATNPESGTINYAYDLNGNLCGRTQGGTGNICATMSGGVQTTYTYDTLNQVLSKTYNDGVTPGVSFGYNFDWLSSTTAGGVVNHNLSFDGFGKVTSSSQTTNGTTWTFPNYQYNLVDSLVSITLPSGRVVGTTYDSAGRASSLQGTLGGTKTYASSIGYAPHGAITAMQIGIPGSGLWQSTSFNSRLQMTSMALGTAQNATNIWGLTNTFSGTQNNGNLLSQSLSVPGVSGTVNTSYQYDGVNRLSKAMENAANPSAGNCASTASQWCRFYGYAAGGNGNQNVTDNSGQGVSTLEPASFNAANQITPICTAPTNSGCWYYDTRGNLTKQVTNQTFGYDAENRQTAYCPNDGNPANCVQTAGNGRTLYYYDGEGRRVLTQAPDGTTTTFVYDAAGNLSAEYGSLAPPAPLCATCYLTTDHLGSTRVITDASGCAVFRQDYLPFGETILSSTGNPRLNATGGTICGTNGYLAAASPARVQFTGQVTDSETGLDFFGARYMSNAQGRFTSPDPSMMSVALRNPQSWNRYSYTLNNPLRYIDPNGELWTAASDGTYGWVDQCEQKQTCYTTVAATSKSDHSVVVYGSKDSGDIQTYFANGAGNVDLREVATGSHDADFEMKSGAQGFLSLSNAAGFFNAAETYHEAYPDDAKLFVTDAGRADGAVLPPHHTHDHGRAIDLRYPDENGDPLQGHTAAANADVDRVRTLVDAGKANGFNQNYSDRPKDFGTGYATGHDTHLHLGTTIQRINPPNQ